MFAMSKRPKTASASLPTEAYARQSVAAEPQPPKSLGSKLKVIVSFLIAVHLLAVIAEPFAFFTRGANNASPAALPIRSVLAPYVEFTYLNHGYFFFAPNPGPSHLLECQLASASGERSRLRLPDLRAQWPRLLYHRHFMLAEFLHQLHVPPVNAQTDATPPDQELLRAWRIERDRFEMVRDSMIKHLRTRYDAQEAEILRLEHRLPSDIEIFRDKMQLSDERLYVVLPDAPIEAAPAAAITEPVGKSSVELPRGNQQTKQPSASEQSPP